MENVELKQAKSATPLGLLSLTSKAYHLKCAMLQYKLDACTSHPQSILACYYLTFPLSQLVGWSFIMPLRSTPDLHTLGYCPLVLSSVTYMHGAILIEFTLFTVALYIFNCINSFQQTTHTKCHTIKKTKVLQVSIGSRCNAVIDHENNRHLFLSSASCFYI